MPHHQHLVLDRPVSTGLPNHRRAIARIRATLPSAPNVESSIIERLSQIRSDESRGLPPVSSIKISPHFDSHPLRQYFQKAELLSLDDLRNLKKNWRSQPQLHVFEHGRIPAAVYGKNHKPSVGHSTAYDQSDWFRDAAVVAAYWRRTENWTAAYAPLHLAWNAVGTNEPYHEVGSTHGWGDSRAKIESFRDDPHAAQRFNSGEALFPIKWSLGNKHRVFPFMNWDHRQIDAYWHTIGAAFRFVSEYNGARTHSMSEREMLRFEPVNLFQKFDPKYKEATEHVIITSIVALRNLRWRGGQNPGIWESFPRQVSTHALLAGMAALDEAYRFFETFGWDSIKHRDMPNGMTLKELIQEERGATSFLLKERIPSGTNALATEHSSRPIDLAMSFALWPFTPSTDPNSGSMTEAQLDTIARTCLTLRRPHGFNRWVEDKEFGPDLYVGGNYMHDPDPNPALNGEFAKLPANWNAQEPSSGDKLAGWTLGESIYAGFHARRYILSGGYDVPSLIRADAHFKAALSQTTGKKYQIQLAGKPGIAPFTIEEGVVPEAWCWDDRQKTLVPVHNGALEMGTAAFLMAANRFTEARALAATPHGRKIIECYYRLQGQGPGLTA